MRAQGKPETSFPLGRPPHFSAFPNFGDDEHSANQNLHSMANLYTPLRDTQGSNERFKATDHVLGSRTASVSIIF